MNEGFNFVRVGETPFDARQKMLRLGLHHLPVIDERGRLVELAVEDILARSDSVGVPALIMAGGEGRRLRPLTTDVPKPLLHVGEKPMLEIVIDQCATVGIQTIYISVNYRAEQIKQRIGDGSRWGIVVEYLEEESPLGTGGALGLLPKPSDRPLLVINGDVLTRVDFSHLLDFHSNHQAVATVCTRVQETQIPFGVVESNGASFLDICEKPTLRHMVSAGVYVISPQIVTLVERNIRVDMPDVIRMATSHGPVMVFPIHEYWSDVGSHEALRQAKKDWS